MHQQEYIYPGTLLSKVDAGDGYVNIGNAYYKEGGSGSGSGSGSKQIWFLLGGNCCRPNDFSHIVSDDSLCVVIYPGYGGTTGTPEPHSIRKTLHKCVRKIKKLGYDEKNMNFLCYSMGCAIGIDYLHLTKMSINKLVLVAPFFSLEDVVYDKYLVPISIIKLLLNHSWDNSRLVDTKFKKLTIAHGFYDKLIGPRHVEKLTDVLEASPEVVDKYLVITTTDDHYTIFFKINIFMNV